MKVKISSERLSPGRMKPSRRLSLSSYLEDEYKAVDEFKVESDKFLKKAETSMRRSRLSSRDRTRSESGDAASPSATIESTAGSSTKSTTSSSPSEGGESPRKSFKQRASMMVDMMDRMRGKRSISKEGGNLLELECDALIAKQQELENGINDVMALALNNESVLLEQACGQWKHVCGCIDRQREQSKDQKVKVDEVSFYVSNMDHTLVDLENIRLYLMEVRELREEGEFSFIPAIYRNISADSEDEDTKKKKEEDEKKKDAFVSIEVVVSRMNTIKLARSSANQFLRKKLLKERETMELSLSHLRDCREVMRKAVEDVVGYMTVEEYIQEKLPALLDKPFDDKNCNDCDTFASMSVQSTGMLEESHDKAASSTELLQQVLMLGATLSSMKMRLAEFTGLPSPTPRN